MRKIWVIILSVVAFALGAFGTLAYTGANDTVAGMQIACELLDKAEASQVLTKQQRVDVIERVQHNIQQSSPGKDPNSGSFLSKFKSGCPVARGR
jgi:hypothetical protein